MEAKATVLGLGDVILDAPEPESFFENSKDFIRAADIAIANMEDPHTNRPSWSNPESHSAPASELDNLRACSSRKTAVKTSVWIDFRKCQGTAIIIFATSLNRKPDYHQTNT